MKRPPWPDTDEKPFVCIDADGEHYNSPNRILYEYRIGTKKSDRKMFVECAVMLAICVAIVGTWGFCIIHTAMSKSDNLPMTERGIEVQEQFSDLSDNDQAQIVQDWQNEQPVDDPGYGRAPNADD